MAKVSYYTEEGLKKLRDELNQLKDERPRASAIAEARDKGDLRAAEYDAGSPGPLELRISKLVLLLPTPELSTNLITSKVLIHSLEVNKSQYAVMKYKLVAQRG